MCGSHPDVRGGCRPRGDQHGPSMRPAGNHLELQRRRRLRPMAYCELPQQFGAVRHARFRMPNHPDTHSQDLWLAQQQHLIIVDWDQGGRIPSTADIERRHGMSRDLIHRVATGRRWMGLAEACALEAVIALVDCPLRRRRDCPPWPPLVTDLEP